MFHLVPTASSIHLIFRANKLNHFTGLTSTQIIRNKKIVHIISQKNVGLFFVGVKKSFIGAQRHVTSGWCKTFPTGLLTKKHSSLFPESLISPLHDRWLLLRKEGTTLFIYFYIKQNCVYYLAKNVFFCWRWKSLLLTSKRSLPLSSVRLSLRAYSLKKTHLPILRVLNLPVEQPLGTSSQTGLQCFYLFA